MSPAEQLRAAAAKLRDTAIDVEYGPPWNVADDVTDLVVSGDLQPYGAPMVARADFGSAPWIAMMSPAVAEPLAAWLYDASLEYERTLRDHGPDAATYAVYHAMPVALAVLGEAP